MPTSSAHEQPSAGSPGHLPARQARALFGILGVIARYVPWINRLRMGGFLHAECAFTWERLRRAQSELQPENERCEKEFLAFGEGLRNLSEHCDEIVSRKERLLALATGQDEGNEAIEAVRELLEFPLSFVSGFAYDSAGLLASAGRTQAALARVLETEAELSRALDPLIYLRTLFHIESARLTSEMFGSMDEEIEGLQRALRTEFVAKFAELRAMRQALIRFTGEYAARARVLAERITAIRGALGKSFEQMKTSVAASGRMQSGIMDATSGLSADVGSMVVALQTHDIVVQRLAHVRRGLDVVGGLLGEVERGDLGYARRALAKLSAVAHLEAAQVHAACGQLSEASRTLFADVEAVVTGIHRFDEDCVMMRAYGQATSGVEGTVQTLLNTTEDTRALVREAAEAAQACSEPLAPLGALVSSVSHDMAHTGEYMRRLALNFQLSAARHGAGTGLEVLAARMAFTSGEVSRICAEADRQIAALASDLRITLDGFAGIVAGSAHMKDLFSGHEQEGLHELRDTTLTAFREVSSVLEIAHQTAAGMRAVDLTRLCGEILPEIESAAQEISKRTHELARILHADPLHADELRALRDQYTMHSERAVHATAIGETAENSERPHGNAGDAELATVGLHADLGANVELF